MFSSTTPNQDILHLFFLPKLYFAKIFLKHTRFECLFFKMVLVVLFWVEERLYVLEIDKGRLF